MDRRMKAIQTEVLRRHREVHNMMIYFPSLAEVRDEWCRLFELVFETPCRDVFEEPMV